jgi:hypothetical protein
MYPHPAQVLDFILSTVRTAGRFYVENDLNLTYIFKCHSGCYAESGKHEREEVEPVRELLMWSAKRGRW